MVFCMQEREEEEEASRLLGPVIQMKLGVTDTLCQAVESTFGALGQAASVGHVVSGSERSID